jgi:hypothetical protein
VRVFSPANWYRVVTPLDAPEQGDLLFDVIWRFAVPSQEQPGGFDVAEITADAIVATQSCDLADRKVHSVEIIPFYSLQEWLYYQPRFFNQLESIRRGYVPGLYLLPGWPDAPIEKAKSTNIVAFDEKRFITFEELDVAIQGERLGLNSPYKEHFAQAVARFYMRVGLPEDMPPIKWKTPIEATSERNILPQTVLNEVGLGPASRPLTVDIQKVELEGGADTLFKAVLTQDKGLVGIGGTPELACGSLGELMAAKRRELFSQESTTRKATHWLVNNFPQANVT